jgi:hypothetical protein
MTRIGCQGPLTFEGDNGDNLWWVQNQQHLDVIYKIHAPLHQVMQVAFTNGHCEGIFANIKLFYFTNLYRPYIIKYH